MAANFVTGDNDGVVLLESGLFVLEIHAGDAGASYRGHGFGVNTSAKRRTRAKEKEGKREGGREMIQ